MFSVCAGVGGVPKLADAEKVGAMQVSRRLPVVIRYVRQLSFCLP